MGKNLTDQWCTVDCILCRKRFTSLIFEVPQQSAKTTCINIMRLENLSLYGMYMYMTTQTFRKTKQHTCTVYM